MIYVTGDCHGDYERFYDYNFPESANMTRRDYVVVAGDFGLWNKDPKYEARLDSLTTLPFTILFCDGNHENFERLLGNEFKEIPWNGGKAKIIRANVLYLERGYVFTIQGKKFFVFGGASSHDIDGGILAADGHTRHAAGEDKNMYFKYIDKDFGSVSEAVKEFRFAKQNYPGLLRVKDWSWWKEEMPDEEEMERGRKSLEAVGNKVDYIVTHCAPTEIVSMLYPWEKHVSDPCTRYLTQIAYNTEFKNWFFGHYHDNRNFGKYILLYEQILRIA